MPSQVTSGILLNELPTVYSNEPKTVLSSSLNRVRAIRNHSLGSLGNGNAPINTSENPSMASCSQGETPSVRQMGFDRMGLSDLLSADADYDFPPTSREFRVILFNDALKSDLFNFKQGVVNDTKAGLLSESSPSYKYLASLAVSLAQSEQAINELKQKGSINEGEFRIIHNQLKNYAIVLSDIGNAYHAELIKRPDEDLRHSFLVVQSHKGGKFTKLCKQTAKMDMEIKSLLNGYPDVNSLISEQMNGSVCQFINHYFQPQVPVNKNNWREFGQYIREDAMDKITALFKNDARNRPGHLFDAGGSEHLYDCYSTIFDYFKPKDEVNRAQDTSPTSRTTTTDQSDGPAAHAESMRPDMNRDLGNGIHNHFSPVFNPINSPNFFNNINDSLLDKLDNNNRLLAEILEKLTSKQEKAQGTQVDPALRPRANTAPESLSRNVTTQMDFSDPVSKPKLSGVVDNAAEIELSKPVAWAKLIDSIHNVTVISAEDYPRASTQIATEYVPPVLGHSRSTVPLPAEKDKPSPDEMNLKPILSKPGVPNELESVKLRPTKTRKPATFEVNHGYQQRNYYEDSGAVSTGFVSDRRAAHEETFLTPQSVISDLTKKAMRAASRSTVITPNELEKIDLKPTQTRDPQSFEVNKGYRDRDYYDGQGNVIPGFVADRMDGFESDFNVLSQDESAFIEMTTLDRFPAKSALTATLTKRHSDIDGLFSPEVATTSAMIKESDFIFQEASNMTQIAAREIRHAEKVQQNHDFLAQLKSEKGIKVM